MFFPVLRKWRTLWNTLVQKSSLKESNCLLPHIKYIIWKQFCAAVGSKAADTYAFLWCGPFWRACLALLFQCCWLPGLWTRTPPRDSSQWQWLTAASPRAAQELRDITEILQSPARSSRENLAMLVMCYLLSFDGWCLKRISVTQPNLFFNLLNKLDTTYTQAVRWHQPTSGNSLPAKKEGCSGLDGVAEDGAVVVHPRSPGHWGSGLCHCGHLTVHRRAGGTWKDK